MKLITEFATHFTERGFKQPSAVQQAVYEPMMAGQSVIGIAPTGSGKTLAFTWPLLPQLKADQGTQLIVIEPSQELAMQTTTVMREWAQLLGLSVQSLTGGANLKRQVERLKKTHPNIVIGTPGRLDHLLAERNLKLHQVTQVVVDEADDLLVDETQARVLALLQAVPKTAQLSFFSATLGDLDANRLSNLVERDLTVIDVRNQDTSQGEVKHGLVKALSMSDKAAMLERLSQTKNFRALVFFTSIKTLHYTASRLKHAGVPVAVLGGKQRQTERETMLRQFRKRQVKLLLTTDVAARGLDIPKLPAVVNFELPQSADAYVHRAGRTGRQGEPGTVMTLGSDHDLRKLKRLMTDHDYTFETLTIARREVKTTAEAKALAKPKAGKLTSKAKPHQVKATATTSQASVSVAPVGGVKKRKKKQKHSKNKGMRHKRRQQNQA